MLQKLQEKITGLSRVAGIEITLLGEGNYSITATVVALKNQKLLVEKKTSGLKTFEELKAFVGSPDIPLAVSLSGKGILHKKSDQVISENEADLLSTVFPNARAADFFIQKSFVEKGVFVSLVRKDLAEPIIAEFKKINLVVISLFLGPFAVLNLLPLINRKETEMLRLGMHCLLFSEGKFSDYKSGELQSEQIKLAEEVMMSDEVVSFGNAFQVISQDEKLSGLTAGSIQEQKKEFKNRKIFKTAGFSYLVLVFLILLCNYFVYLHYKNENAGLSSESVRYEDMLKEVERLENLSKEKEIFLKTAGWLSIPRTSFFADQIAASVPSTVKLRELKVHPLNEKLSKEGRKLLFQSDTVIISGSCVNPTVLNPWLEQLKELDWVESGRNEDYKHDSKNKEGNFNIQLRIAHDF